MGDEMMRLGVYVIAWVITTRLIHWGMVESSPTRAHPGILVPAFLGALWPVALGIAVVAAPFALIGWLASLGVRRGA